MVTDKDHHEVVRTLLEGRVDLNAKDIVRKQMLLMMMMITTTPSSHSIYSSSHSMHPSNYLSFYSTNYHSSDLGSLVH